MDSTEKEWERFRNKYAQFNKGEAKRTNPSKVIHLRAFPGIPNEAF